MVDYIVLALGELLNEGYNEKLDEAFKKFSCSRETDLEDFLMRKAVSYDNIDFGRTYLIVDKEKLLKDEQFVIMAYFTIAIKSLDISVLSTKKKRTVFGDHPGRDSLNSIPAYLIGQLGRSDTYSSKDISGENILNECYHAISNAAKVVGGKVVVLECRECMFEKFYEHQGFKKFYKDLNEENLYTLYKRVDFSEYWGKTKK